MNLREVVKQDEEKIIEMYEEYMSSELIPGIDRFEGIRDFEKLEKLSFNDWIDDLEKNKYEKNLPESYSPYTLYLAINDNNKIVGAIGIRWKQVPVLMTFGGLIGYSVRPSQRGKGYASEMLKLALDKFKNTNIENNTNSTSSNPKTGDNIVTFVAMFIVSVLGIAITVKHKKTLR